MLSSISVALAVSAALLFGGPAGAQSPQASTGSVTGQVANEGGPIRHVVVSVSRLGGEKVAPRRAVTDSKGRFRVTDLPYGAYRVSANRSGTYLAPVELELSALTPDVSVALVGSRAGAIRGRLFLVPGRLAPSGLTVEASPETQSEASVAGKAQVDPDGWFRIHSLPEGRYALKLRATAGGRGSAPAMVVDGPKVSVAAGSDTDVTVDLPSGPVTGLPAGHDTLVGIPTDGGRILGKVRDKNSQEVLGGAVVTLTGSGGRLVRVTSANGRFEFTDLPQGSYRLTAVSDGYATGEYGQVVIGVPGSPIDVPSRGSVDVAIDIIPFETFRGVVLDELGEPLPDVQVQLGRRAFVAGEWRVIPPPSGAMTAITDDIGAFVLPSVPPGDYVAMAAPSVLSPSGDGTAAASGFSVTYYPGVDSAALSTLVTSGDGNVDSLIFRVQPSAVADLSVRVTSTQGMPAKAVVLAIPINQGELAVPLMAPVQTSTDGIAKLPLLPFGRYLLQALGTSPASFYSTEVVIDNEKMSHDAQLYPEASLAGRVVRLGVASLAPSDVKFSVLPTDLAAAPMVMRPSPSRVFEDWTFNIGRVRGAVAIRAILPAPWALERVMLRGLDVTDSSIVVNSTPVEDLETLEIVVTSETGQVTGTVTDGAGPCRRCFVLLYSTERAKWRFPSRFIKVLGTDESGRFTAGSLLPADYYIVATRTADPMGLESPEFLLSLIDDARRIVVGKDSVANVALHAGR